MMFLIGMEFALLYFIFLIGKRTMGNRKGLLIAIIASSLYFAVYEAGIFHVVLEKINVGGTVVLGIYISCLAVIELLFYFTKYKVPYVDRGAVFSGKKVLALVPHQDDEVNLLGSIPVEYVRNGSEFYLAYLTNGDSEGYESGLRRLKEALLAAYNLGIREENIYFLGYGNGYAEDILRVDEDSILVSKIGRHHTYALKRKPPFSEKEYIKKNMLGDLERLIKELHPDVIFCVDVDSHIEHRLLSQLFDRVMNRVVQTDYEPVVYKGFAYSTAWTAEDDFYMADNIESSKFPDVPLPPNYKWEERIRFPIAACDLKRSISACKSYKILWQYKSQNAASRCGRVINGDKVFWRADESNRMDVWIKLIDSNGNFLYDYVTMENCIELFLYDTREGEKIDCEYFEFTLKNNDGCKYKKHLKKIVIELEDKASCIVEVRDKRDANIYDAIRIRKVNKMYKIWLEFMLHLEKLEDFRLQTQWYDFEYLIATFF